MHLYISAVDTIAQIQLSGSQPCSSGLCCPEPSSPVPASCQHLTLEAAASPKGLGAGKGGRKAPLSTCSSSEWWKGGQVLRGGPGAGEGLLASLPRILPHTSSQQTGVGPLQQQVPAPSRDGQGALGPGPALVPEVPQPHPDEEG